jgi:hypothetical protein
MSTLLDPRFAGTVRRRNEEGVIRMRRAAIVRFLRTGMLLAVVSLPGGSAWAQATRTWVSGVGDDANPCSRTAPCKTFAGAISKTAAGGEINVLDPGGFGGVTITKSITISSEGFEAGVLVSGTNAIVVNAPASAVVVLRGLDIEGLGTGLNGIRFLAGGALHVENCTINNFAQKGIAFEPSGLSELYVIDTIVRNNQVNATTSGGIFIKPTVTGTAVASLDNVRLDNNLFGLRVEGGSQVTGRRVFASGNSTVGFIALGTAVGSVLLTLESGAATNNGTNGVRSDQAGATVRISNMVITDNVVSGLRLNGGAAIISSGNNTVLGNGVDGSPTSTVPPI